MRSGLLSYIIVIMSDKPVSGGPLIQIDQETQEVDMSTICIIEPSQDCGLAKPH